MRTPPDKVRRGLAVLYILVMDGVVRYVGQTRTPKKRQYEHQRVLNCEFEMLMIRVTWAALACRIEQQIIKAYQRRGLADLNGKLYAGRISKSRMRTTISLSSAIARKGERRARQDGRNFSNYVARLIDADDGK